MMRLFPFFYWLQLRLWSHGTTKLQYLQEELHLPGDESTGYVGIVASTFIGVVGWQMPRKKCRAISNNKLHGDHCPKCDLGRNWGRFLNQRYVFYIFPLIVFIPHIWRNLCFKSKPISNLLFLKIAKGFYLSLFASQQLKRTEVQILLFSHNWHHPGYHVKLIQLLLGWMRRLSRWPNASSAQEEKTVREFHVRVVAGNLSKGHSHRLSQKPEAKGSCHCLTWGPGS